MWSDIPPLAPMMMMKANKNWNAPLHYVWEIVYVHEHAQGRMAQGHAPTHAQLGFTNTGLMDGSLPNLGNLKTPI